MSVPVNPKKSFMSLFSALFYMKEQFRINKSRYIRRYRELYSSSKPIFFRWSRFKSCYLFKFKFKLSCVIIIQKTFSFSFSNPNNIIQNSLIFFYLNSECECFFVYFWIVDGENPQLVQLRGSLGQRTKDQGRFCAIWACPNLYYPTQQKETWVNPAKFCQHGPLELPHQSPHPPLSYPQRKCL